jgi:hypothetical protein
MSGRFEAEAARIMEGCGEWRQSRLQLRIDRGEPDARRFGALPPRPKVRQTREDREM